jgi:tetratricopeptide (TPR) repeat protein
MLGGRFEESIRVGTEALPLVEALGMEDLRARIHIVVGCARCCLGEAGGLDEIERGISIAQAAGALEMLVIGYGNLSSELQFFARTAQSRRASERALELAERYGIARLVRSGRLDVAAWAYLDGRWEEATAIADELIAASEAGDTDYNDPAVLALRAWIRLARGDLHGADRDSGRATELARASDLQAQVAAYPTRAAVALKIGRREEAHELASDLVAIGPAMVAALCLPFPTLADVAWVFKDLGRETELADAILDPDPIKSPWHHAARAIVDGDFARAADILDDIDYTASAERARLRAAEVAKAEGRTASEG